MKFLFLVFVFVESLFAMPVITITGIMPFDYFSSIFIYMTITLISMFGVLSIFTSK